MAYITYTEDVGENEGGFYCEVYSDDMHEHQIDAFCIPAKDIGGNYDYEKAYKWVEENGLPEYNRAVVYCVCALSYDKAGNSMDYEMYFGEFSDVNDAKSRFKEVIAEAKSNPNKFFGNELNDVYQWDIRIELCLSNDESDDCIDVIEEETFIIEDSVHPFTDDAEKMMDYYGLTKKAFLLSYSYLTEAEYDATAKLRPKTGTIYISTYNRQYLHKSGNFYADGVTDFVLPVSWLNLFLRDEYDIDLSDFIESYTYDDTLPIYEKAKEEKVIVASYSYLNEDEDPNDFIFRP